jgi:hypothetical protein
LFGPLAFVDFFLPSGFGPLGGGGTEVNLGGPCLPSAGVLSTPPPPAPAAVVDAVFFRRFFADSEERGE